MDDEAPKEEEEPPSPGFFEVLDPPDDVLRAALLRTRQTIEARLLSPLSRLGLFFGAQPASVLPPGRSEEEIRKALSWFNSGAGPTPALICWFSCFDGGFGRIGSKVNAPVLSLAEAVRQRQAIANLAASDDRWTVYRLRTDYLPLASDGRGNDSIYEARLGRRGVVFNDHEEPGADFEHAGAQGLIEFLAELEAHWMKS